MHENLTQPAEQHGDGNRHDAGQPERRHDRHENQRADDRRDIEHRGRERRHEVVVQGVEHAHRHGRDRHHHQERQHHAREQDRELQLARHARVIAGVQRDERTREDEPGGDERERRDQERVQHVVGETPRGGPAVERQMAREGRDERGAHGALREEIADEIRNPERDV